MFYVSDQLHLPIWLAEAQGPAAKSGLLRNWLCWPFRLLCSGFPAAVAALAPFCPQISSHYPGDTIQTPLFMCAYFIIKSNLDNTSFKHIFLQQQNLKISSETKWLCCVNHTFHPLKWALFNLLSFPVLETIVYLHYIVRYSYSIRKKVSMKLCSSIFSPTEQCYKIVPLLKATLIILGRWPSSFGFQPKCI